MVRAVMSLTSGDFSHLSIDDQAILERQELARRERYNKLMTEIHGRVALSCSCIFFVFLGSPFAILFGRRQFLTNFAACFAPILMGYYPVVLLTMNLCRDGVINPLWGMWIANAGMLAFATVVLRKALRH